MNNAWNGLMAQIMEGATPSESKDGAAVSLNKEVADGVNFAFVNRPSTSSGRAWDFKDGDRTAKHTESW